MTLKEAQKQARAHGMVIKNTGYDYRVSFKGDKSEAHAVYEGSVQDTLDTAKAMWEYRYGSGGGLQHL